MKWLEELNKHSTNINEILSFDQYMNIFKAQPMRECRTCAIYLKDLFDFYGKNKNGGFKIFTKDQPDTPPVHGQTKTQEEIYQNLINFTEVGFNNKFLLLVGPNGSAKTSLVKKIMKSAEEYSQHEDGALYTFSWIFPIDNYIKGSLGFSSQNKGKTKDELESFAHLSDNEISAILSSELKDHPILLLPIELRQKLIKDVLKNNPKRFESIKNSYLYTGDISKKNRMIFDALLKSYKGDYATVFKHIRVERFNINRRYSASAVSIEPQLHVDARLQQITMDKRLANLPPSLQSIDLFNMHGEVIMANRGILEFSDLLKRPLDTFKYLLMTMESKTINLHGILTELDICFFGTSNEIHLAAFKQHPDFNSFKGRFQFLTVPYLLNSKEEAKIYAEQINSLKGKITFEPHAIDTLCLWCVMTRLRPSLSKNFSNTDLAKLITSMNPLEKALYYSGDELPARFESEDRKLLKQFHQEIVSEFDHDSLYEGKFGISPREIKQIIFDLTAKYENITFVEIIEYLQTFIQRKNEHDFLNIAANGDYNNPAKFIELIEHFFLDKFDSETRKALGMVDERSYEDYISKYVLHVNSLIKHEKIKNTITGKFEDPDKYFIKEFETNIDLKESPESFRSHMISTLGAYSLDNPKKGIVYADVFSDLVHLLQESFRVEQKKVIDKISQNLIYYIAEKHEAHGKNPSLSEENREIIFKLIDNLKNKFNYSEEGVMSLLKYLLKKRY